MKYAFVQEPVGLEPNHTYEVEVVKVTQGPEDLAPTLWLRFVGESPQLSESEWRAEQRHAEADPEGRWLAWPPTRQLKVGHEYLVRTGDGSQLHLVREHRMSFLGMTDFGDGLIFNARPAFGTQEFRPYSITATMDLGKSEGREDHKRYMNKVIK